MREWLARLADWFRRDRLSDELRDELRFHQSQLERDALADGADTEDAHWRARKQLGNVTRVAEQTRDRWSIPWLDHLQQDLRYAWRGLRRSPVFTITIVVTLGLGIGADVAMFGVIDRLMFRPFAHLRDPNSVNRVYLSTVWRVGPSTYTVFPYARYLDLRRWTTSFSEYAAFVSEQLGVGTGEAAREREVAAVSASFFDFFDARPTVGRFFDASEDSAYFATNVAVLGYDFWNVEYARRDAIGETLQIGNASYVIIGVAPERFVGVAEHDAPAVYIPITAYAANNGGSGKNDYTTKYNWDWAQMMVRRKQGVSVAAATADLSNAFLRSWNASRIAHPRYRTADVALPSAIAGPLKQAAGPAAGLEARTLLWVTGVAVIVLLIACANVANILLARAMSRRREIAVRLALGVSRTRLAMQMMTETLILAVLGGAAGLLIAQWAGLAMRRLFVDDEGSAWGDWRMMSVAFAAAAVTAIATGSAPAILAGRDALADALKAGARAGTHRRSRARGALLVAQGALSALLLVGAGLFVRSLLHVRDLRLGYDIDPLLVVNYERRGTPIDSAGRVALRARMREAAAALPGVADAAWTNSAPFASGTSILTIAVPGIDSVNKLGRFTYQIAAQGYFETIGTRIVLGRGFSQDDRIESPRVVVVSEEMAAKLWPHANPIGRCMRVTMDAEAADALPCTTVVGVAENAVYDPASDLPLRYYLPESQWDWGATWLLLRTSRPPALVAEEARRAIQAVVPGQMLVTVRPARDLLDAKRRSWLIGATLFVVFGGLALVVAAVGLYGAIAYDVSRRLHEMGVRLALGARRSNVVGLVIGQGARFALIGFALGSACALVCARWIAPLLFEQSPYDPLIYLGVGILLTTVALCASGIPASRASRTDPSRVLRAE